jgi:hypothetical protein
MKHRHLLVAAAALGAVSLPAPPMPRVLVRETEPKGTPDQVTRQRKRYLERQARKNERRHRK